jgi:hypothetical protein
MQTMPSTTSKSPRDAARVIALVAALVAASSCGDAVREGTGSAFLVIENLSAASGGGSAGSFENTLRSDVLTEGSVYEDPGRVTVRLAPKDHTSPLTTNNYVTLTRYRVVFTRSDGRNTQGVDVPYAFDGALTFNVGDDSATGNFVLVRAQSKLEPPLMQLRGQGGAVVISTLAQVTFYGTDQTGHEVTATGTLSVNFADWADPQ